MLKLGMHRRNSSVFKFPYSGLNVTMPLPDGRHGVVRYSSPTIRRRRESSGINQF